MHLQTRAATAAATALILSALTLPAAHAQTTFFSTGFEASEAYSTTYTRQTTVSNQSGPIVTLTPTPGTLYFEPRTTEIWDFSIPTGLGGADAITKIVNSTTVVNTSAATGTQSVQIVGNTLGALPVEWHAVQNLVAQQTAGSYAQVSSDVRVTNPSANYGQWGVSFRETRDGLNYTVGAMGFVGTNVLASNDGNTIFAAINLATGQAYSANYGAYNNYAVRMNYDTRTISGFFNGAQVGFVPLDANGNPNPAGFTLNMPFAATTRNTIATANIGQGLDRGASENANFDNYRVSGVNVSAAPEPGTLPLLGMGLVSGAGALGAMRRRRRCA